MAEREACLKRWQRLVTEERTLARAWYTSRIAEVSEVGGPDVLTGNEEKAAEPDDRDDGKVDDLEDGEDGGPVESKESVDQTANFEGRESKDCDDSTSDEPATEVELTATSGRKVSNSHR
jgi:hypothetical protein